MTTFRLVLLMCLLPTGLHGAFERPFRPASAFSLGVAGVVSFESGGWLVNPASLAGTTSPYLLGTFNPAPLGLSELKEAGIGGALTVASIGVGGAVSLFGTPMYREVTTRIALGCPIGRVVTLGMAGSFYHLSLKGYGNAGTLGIDAGVIAHLGASIRVGVAATNLNAPCIGACREALPQTFRIGSTLDLLARFSFSLELMKDTRYPASLSYGVEYRPVSAVSFSFGLASEPAAAGGGFGISFSRFHLEYSMQYHQVLGISSFVSVAFSFSNARREAERTGIFN